MSRRDDEREHEGDDKRQARQKREREIIDLLGELEPAAIPWLYCRVLMLARKEAKRQRWAPADLN